MDAKNSPEKINKSEHEIINVLVLSGKKPINAVFVLNENCGNEVELTLTFAGYNYKSHAPTFFEAMNKIRLILEKDNIYPICYGTYENIYPSGTTITTATGRTAYRCTTGKPVLSSDIVDIFDADSFCIPVTVQAQKQFNIKWRKSITDKITNNKIRISPKFKNICFTVCIAFWVIAFVYYFLKGETASGGFIFLLIILGCAVVFIPVLPFFEPVYNTDKKILNSIKAIPVEKQLGLLAELGIKLKQAGYIKFIYDECNKETLESNPYNPLLFSFGSQYLSENSKKWEWLSDDVFTFDTECVDGYDLYSAVFERLSILSKGIFDVKDVSGKINHEQKTASVSFLLNGNDYSWSLRYDDDWFDVLVIGRINTLLKNMGSGKFFFMSIPGRIINIVFCTKEIKTRLDSLITKPYILEFYEDDNKVLPSFTLRTNNGSFSNNMLCYGLFDLILTYHDPDDFLVLAPKVPLGNSTFLQVAFNTKKKPAKKAARKKSGNSTMNADYVYSLEAGFGGKRRSVAMYHLNTNNKDVVLQYFIDYWYNRITPDISSWENITGELK